MGRRSVGSVRGPEYDLLLQLLKEARIKSGLQQKEICDRLGKPRNYVIKVESGERRLDVIELFQLCAAIGQDPIELLILWQGRACKAMRA